MKLILLENVEKLGKAGDVVNVSAGYGRNFLLPKKYAILANNKSLKTLETIKRTAAEKTLKAQNLLRATALELTDTELIFWRKADDNGHLYGSVSDADIVNELKEKGFDIHKNMIVGEKHLKQTGLFDITISFTQEISAPIKINIQEEVATSMRTDELNKNEVEEEHSQL